MIDRTHDNESAKVRAIVDDAIAELLMVGLASRDEAATLMAIQSIVRIEGQEAIKTVADFATSSIVDE